MRVWWPTIGVALAVTLAGCGGESGTPAAGGEGRGAGEAASAPDHRRAGLPFSLTAEQREGKDVYDAVCWTCHGKSGRGDGPAVEGGSVPAPPDFTTGEYPELDADQLLNRFRRALARGEDPAHPHMQYVTSILREDVFRAALSYVPVIGYPPEIAASAVAGGEIYVERCAGCHGFDGRGSGPVSPQLTVQPADFTADTLIAARDFEGLYSRIREGGGQVHGSSMPAWGLLYGEESMRDLAAYVSTFQLDVLSEPPGGDD